MAAEPPQTQPDDAPRSGTGSGARSGPRSGQAADRTRLAPSPTGALHLGNARTFLINWALARQNGWAITLRIEDLDTPRVRQDRIDGTRRDLVALGIDWDDEAPLQSTDLGPCRDAMGRLAAAGLVYPCARTRREIDAALAALSAPNEPEPGGPHETRVPPELRPDRPWPAAFDDPGVNWRFACPAGPVSFTDAVRGGVSRTPADTVGDFPVWTARDCPAYQLAVVVDDARQGVTQVVRGDDLLDSTARQKLLIDALGIGPPPAYTHVPLVRGPDGRRLAKRHGDTRVATYFAAGVRAERVIGLLARWSGVTDPAGPRREVSAAEFAAGFGISTMPRGDVTFTEEDDAWLRGGTG